LQKEQKIKSKYKKYANLVFLLISSVILYLLYILFIGREFGMIEEYQPPSNMDGFKQKAQSFQPSDERSQSPGKLKWGKDFDFAKSEK